MEKKLSSKKFACGQGFILCISLFCLFVLLFCNTIQAQIHLVKDINQNAKQDNNEFSSLIDVDGALFFTSKNKELWKTDGTLAGSFKIKEFKQISEMKNVGGILYFFATDTGFQSLWKSDGTLAGTIKVKESTTGYSMTAVNGMLYFIGSGIGTGLEVWRSDGTAAGTFMVKDIMKGGGNSNPTSLTSFNNKLYFVANNGTNGYEIWETNGTLAGTHIFKDIIPGKTSSQANYLTVASNTLFFMARDAALGQELWKSDGTPEGTVLVKDVQSGSGSSFPSTFISVNETIYFRANDGHHNFQLWRSDGTADGTIMLTSSGYSWINGLQPVNNYLYYMLGRTLYRTDGTVAGTLRVHTIEDFYSPKEMVTMNGSLYVMSTDYEFTDLWRIDGSNASVVVRASTSASGYSAHTGLVSSGNAIYFIGNGGDEQVSSLWKSDGTAVGTTSFLDLDSTTADSNINYLTDVNGTLYFNVYDGVNNGVWKSDGTAAGTQLVSDVFAYNLKSFNNNLFFSSYSYLYKSDGTATGTVPVSTEFSNAGNLTVTNNTLFFSGISYPNGFELCKTNGTSAGTILVKDINNGNASSSPQYLTNVNGVLYFSATSEGQGGTELWRSDGTTSGTVRVKDINQGSASSSPYGLTAFNNQLYFVAYTPTNGYELWKSDGTESGTVMVKDIYTVELTSRHIEGLMAVNNLLYFTATDDQGLALWRTDGTEAGTFKLRDFYDDFGVIQLVNSLNNEIYVRVFGYGNYKHELWKSNGSIAGTVLVKKIGVNENGLSTSVVHNGILYLDLVNQIDNYSSNNFEIWRTDGTACGTFRVAYKSMPTNLILAGDKLFLTGNIDLAGRELLRLEESEIIPPACLSSAKESEQEIVDLTDPDNTSIHVVQYPNPFSITFSLRVNGKENIMYSVKAITMNGAELEQHHDLITNVDYAIGADWKPGLYLLKIEIDGKSVIRKMMKGNDF
jgi:ELWxxDGT repeat protein